MCPVSCEISMESPELSRLEGAGGVRLRQEGREGIADGLINSASRKRA